MKQKNVKDFEEIHEGTVYISKILSRKDSFFRIRQGERDIIKGKFVHLGDLDS